MAFESRKLGFVSLEAEYVSTQANLPCVSFPLLTVCVIFALCCLGSTLTVYTHTPSLEGKRLCSGLPIRHGEGWDAEEPGIQPQSPASNEQ